MLNNENVITLFVVSSVRTYSDGKIHRGTDAIFLDADQAEAHIQYDMYQTLKTNCFDDDPSDLTIDYEGYTIKAPSRSFGWQIDPVEIRLSEAEQLRLCRMLFGGENARNNRNAAKNAAAVMHGLWEAGHDYSAVCSVCGIDFCGMFHNIERFRYCPNCGAKMDGLKGGLS